MGARYGAPGQASGVSRQLIRDHDAESLQHAKKEDYHEKPEMADDQRGSRSGSGHGLGGADPGPRAQPEARGQGWGWGQGQGQGAGNNTCPNYPAYQNGQGKGNNPQANTGRRGPRGGGRNYQPNTQPTVPPVTQ